MAMGNDEHGPAYPEPTPANVIAFQDHIKKIARYRCGVCRTADRDQYLICNHPMCPDGCDQAFRFYPNEGPPLPLAPGYVTMLLGWAVVAALCVWLMWPHQAPAMDHGFDPGDKGVQWFESLKIPPMEMVSCCGKADAYPVDRYTKLPNGDYEVWVEDGSAHPYPDGTKRVPWDESVPITVPAARVNKEDDDLTNPTDHGWLFFIPRREYPGDGSEPKPSTVVSEVYCFIRHPQGN
jgi:hypothetical protein